MRRVAAAIVLLAAASCTPAPPVVLAPAVPAHPDFVFPAAPPGTPPATLERLERGWRLLQSDDDAGAEREFAAVLSANRDFTPALAGQGYVALARQRPDDALAAFDRATAAQTGYAPALVGRGLALLAAGRDDEALASFEAALVANPTLPEVASRVEVLRVRQLQDRVSRAERRPRPGATTRPATPTWRPWRPHPSRHSCIATWRAPSAAPVASTPRSTMRGAPWPSTTPTPRSHLVVAEIREEQGDFAGALAAYDRAAALDPSPAIAAAIARVRERARDAALPPQYHAIATSPAATRADLAALLGVRLGGVLAAAPQRQLVVTDVRGHWAQPWIEATARSGAMEVFSNYTFQPATPLRRADVADVVSRVLALVSRGSATVSGWDQTPVEAADVPPGHLAYPAVRRAVAAGVMPLADRAFGLLQPVTGAELAAVVSRLEALGGGQ